MVDMASVAKLDSVPPLPTCSNGEGSYCPRVWSRRPDDGFALRTDVLRQ